MKKKLINQLLLFVFMCCIGIPAAFGPANQVMKATIAGFPTFECSDVSNMPLGATGGLATLVKAPDNIDQQLDKAMKNKTAITAMDIVYFQKSATGQLTKTQSFHFTKLVVKSLVPNANKVTAVSLSYENMTKN